MAAVVSALPLLRHLGAYQIPAERESREQSVLLTQVLKTPLTAAPRTVTFRAERRTPNVFHSLH